MICLKCGREYEDSLEFCEHCGEKNPAGEPAESTTASGSPPPGTRLLAGDPAVENDTLPAGWGWWGRLSRTVKAALICVAVVSVAGSMAAWVLISAGERDRTAPLTLEETSNEEGLGEFRGGGMELWLPEGSKVFDLSGDNLDWAVDELKSSGNKYRENMGKLIKGNPSVFVMVAYVEHEAGSKPYNYSVVVTSEPVPPDVDIEECIESEIEHLPTLADVVDKGTETLGGYEAGKIVIEGITPRGHKVKQITYSIKDDDKLWNISYTTGAKHFDMLLPSIEMSARTFKADGS